MRTKTLALTALVFLMSSCGNKTSNKIEQDKKHTGWDDYGLKGEVKSLRQISSYKAVNKFGKIQKGDMDDYYSENVYVLFNKKGNQVELNWVEWNWYKSDGSLGSKWTYKYDNKGNQIETNRYKSDGSLGSKWTYKYDNKGNKVEENLYNSDGSLDSKWTYKYDNKGNQVERDSYKSDGSLYWKWTYKYDDKGNPVEWNNYKSDGSLGSKCTYKYDNKGNLVEENSYMSDGSLNYQRTYTYTYDKKGNWNKQITFKNTIPQTIIEREIVYF